MHTSVRELLYWTWCFPQSLLGSILYGALLLCGRVQNKAQFRGATLVKVKSIKYFGGIALGKFNFVSARNWNKNTLLHEYGHTRQSFMLGPSYLIVVGIPSLFWTVNAYLSSRIRKTYYSRYPENWADRLGKVKRAK
jgi:hypothetical protein